MRPAMCRPLLFVDVLPLPPLLICLSSAALYPFLPDPGGAARRRLCMHTLQQRVMDHS